MGDLRLGFDKVKMDLILVLRTWVVGDQYFLVRLDDRNVYDV